MVEAARQGCARGRRGACRGRGERAGGGACAGAVREGCAGWLQSALCRAAPRPPRAGAHPALGACRRPAPAGLRSSRAERTAYRPLARRLRPRHARASRLATVPLTPSSCPSCARPGGPTRPRSAARPTRRAPCQASAAHARRHPAGAAAGAPCARPWLAAPDASETRASLACRLLPQHAAGPSESGRPRSGPRLSRPPVDSGRGQGSENPDARAHAPGAHLLSGDLRLFGCTGAASP